MPQSYLVTKSFPVPLLCGAADLAASRFGPASSQLGKKESIADTARVLGRMFDGIEYRGFEQARVEDLARYAGVPVWNGLTNEYHPTQVLADLFTMEEHFKGLKGRKLSYFGDARFNMGNSLMIGCAKMGVHFTACAPEKYFPNPELIARCRRIAEESGAILSFEIDPMKGARGADVLYTDVWVSMGEPEEVWNERIADLMPPGHPAADELRKPLHALPARLPRPEFGDRHGHLRKVRAGLHGSCRRVFEGPASIVFDEAENRLHTIKR